MLRIVTEISPNGGVKPVEVVAAVYGLTDAEKVSLSSRVRRTRLYSEDATGDGGAARGAGVAGDGGVAGVKYGPLPSQLRQPGIAN
jgi:hypothetical protein